MQACTHQCYAHIHTHAHKHTHTHTQNYLYDHTSDIHRHPSPHTSTNSDTSKLQIITREFRPPVSWPFPSPPGCWVAVSSPHPPPSSGHAASWSGCSWRPPPPAWGVGSLSAARCIRSCWQCGCASHAPPAADPPPGEPEQLILHSHNHLPSLSTGHKWSRVCGNHHQEKMVQMNQPHNVKRTKKNHLDCPPLDTRRQM